MRKKLAILATTLVISAGAVVAPVLPPQGMPINEYQALVEMYDYEIKEMNARGDNVFVNVTSRNELLSKLNTYIRNNPTKKDKVLGVSKETYTAMREYLIIQSETKGKRRSLIQIIR